MNISKMESQVNGLDGAIVDFLSSNGDNEKEKQLISLCLAGNDIERTLKNFRLLGYAGHNLTQTAFSKAVFKLLCGVDFTAGNKANVIPQKCGLLFSEDYDFIGFEILSRLIWTSNNHDASSSNNNAATIAHEILDKIVDNFQEFLNYVGKIMLFTPPAYISKALVLEWCLRQIFVRTVSDEDESCRHTFFTYESIHPYRPYTQEQGVISVLGSTQLRVSFDTRTVTERDSGILTFYEDEERTKVATCEGKALRFSGNKFTKFEFNGDTLWYSFTSKERTKDYYGYRMMVKAKFKNDKELAKANGYRKKLYRSRITRNGTKESFINILRDCICSEDNTYDMVRLYAALTLANITLYEDESEEDGEKNETTNASLVEDNTKDGDQSEYSIKQKLVSKFGFDFFVQFPIHPTYTSVIALCISELLEDPVNQAVAFADSKVTLYKKSQLLKRIYQFILDENLLTRTLGVKSLYLLASYSANRELLVFNGALEVLYYILERCESISLLRKTWDTLSCLLEDTDLLAEYGARTTIPVTTLTARSAECVYSGGTRFLVPPRGPPLPFFTINVPKYDEHSIVRKHYRSPTLRYKLPITSGRVYFEYRLITSGVQYLGVIAGSWNNNDKYIGIGQDQYGYSYCKAHTSGYHNGKVAVGKGFENEGSIVGVLADYDDRIVHFTLDGKDIGIQINYLSFDWNDHGGLYPALTIEEEEAIEVNIGHSPLIYLPPDCQSLKDYAETNQLDLPSTWELRIVDKSYKECTWKTIERKDNIIQSPITEIIDDATIRSRVVAKQFLNASMSVKKKKLATTGTSTTFSTPQVFESNHPLEEKPKFEYGKWVGAIALIVDIERLTFSKNSRKKESLTIYKTCDGVQMVEKFMTSITSKRIVILSDELSLLYDIERGSGSPLSSWGYRILVTPQYSNDILKLEDKTVTMMNSSHPLDPSKHEPLEVEIEGANAFQVSFNEQSDVGTYGYIQFSYDAAGLLPCSEAFTGAALETWNWPGVQDRPLLIINSSKVWLTYHKNTTTASFTTANSKAASSWGYEFTCVKVPTNLDDYLGKPGFSKLYSHELNDGATRLVTLSEGSYAHFIFSSRSILDESDIIEFYLQNPDKHPEKSPFITVYPMTTTNLNEFCLPRHKFWVKFKSTNTATISTSEYVLSYYEGPDLYSSLSTHTSNDIITFETDHPCSRHTELSYDINISSLYVSTLTTLTEYIYLIAFDPACQSETDQLYFKYNDGNDMINVYSDFSKRTPYDVKYNSVYDPIRIVSSTPLTTLTAYFDCRANADVWGLRFVVYTPDIMKTIKKQIKNSKTITTARSGGQADDTTMTVSSSPAAFETMIHLLDCDDKVSRILVCNVLCTVKDIEKYIELETQQKLIDALCAVLDTSKDEQLLLSTIQAIKNLSMSHVSRLAASVLFVWNKRMNRRLRNKAEADVATILKQSVLGKQEDTVSLMIAAVECLTSTDSTNLSGDMIAYMISAISVYYSTPLPKSLLDNFTTTALGDIRVKQAVLDILSLLGHSSETILFGILKVLKSLFTSAEILEFIYDSKYDFAVLLRLSVHTNVDIRMTAVDAIQLLSNSKLVHNDSTFESRKLVFQTCLHESYISSVVSAYVNDDRQDSSSAGGGNNSPTRKRDSISNIEDNFIPPRIKTKSEFISQTLGYQLADFEDPTWLCPLKKVTSGNGEEYTYQQIYTSQVALGDKDNKQSDLSGYIHSQLFDLTAASATTTTTTNGFLFSTWLYTSQEGVVYPNSEKSEDPAHLFSIKLSDQKAISISVDSSLALHVKLPVKAIEKSKKSQELIQTKVKTPKSFLKRSAWTLLIISVQSLSTGTVVKIHQHNSATFEKTVPYKLQLQDQSSSTNSDLASLSCLSWCLGQRFKTLKPDRSLFKGIIYNTRIYVPTETALMNILALDELLFQESVPLQRRLLKSIRDDALKVTETLQSELHKLVPTSPIVYQRRSFRDKIQIDPEEEMKKLSTLSLLKGLQTFNNAFKSDKAFNTSNDTLVNSLILTFDKALYEYSKTTQPVLEVFEPIIFDTQQLFPSISGLFEWTFRFPLTTLDADLYDSFKIWFDETTNLPHEDYSIRFYKSNDFTATGDNSGSNRYNGPIGSDFYPTEDDPLIMPATKGDGILTLWIETKLSDENQDWNFKIYAVPVSSEILEASLHDNDTDEENVIILESPHPYSRDMDEYIPIEIPGASQLEIKFDPRCSTETKFDYITLFKDKSYKDFWGKSRVLSGGSNGSSKNFPLKPLIIPTGKFIFYFHSDGKNNSEDWGYRVIIRAYTPPVITNDLQLLRCSTGLLLNGFTNPTFAESIIKHNRASEVLIMALDTCNDVRVQSSLSSILVTIASNPNNLKIFTNNLLSQYKREPTNELCISTIKYITGILSLITSSQAGRDSTYMSIETTHPPASSTKWAQSYRFPLASSLLITYDKLSEFLQSTLIVTSEDNVSMMFNHETSLPCQPITIAGSKLNLKYKTKYLPQQWGYKMNIYCTYDEDFDDSGELPSQVMNTLYDMSHSEFITNCMKATDDRILLDTAKLLANLCYASTAATGGSSQDTTKLSLILTDLLTLSKRAELGQSFYENHDSLNCLNLCTNIKREVSRGLLGALEWAKQNEMTNIVKTVMTYSKSDDTFTMQWCTKTLLSLYRNAATIKTKQDLSTVLLSNDSINLLQSSSILDTSLFAECMETLFIQTSYGLELIQLIGNSRLNMITNTEGMLVESEHPYNNTTSSITVRELYLPGASALHIIFDSETQLVCDGDMIEFFKEDPRLFDDITNESHRIGEKYSGNAVVSFPSERSPLLVPQGRLWVRITTAAISSPTDSSLLDVTLNATNEPWGYRFAVLPATARATIANSNDLSKLYYNHMNRDTITTQTDYFFQSLYYTTLDTRIKASTNISLSSEDSFTDLELYYPGATLLAIKFGAKVSKDNKQALQFQDFQVLDEVKAKELNLDIDADLYLIGDKINIKVNKKFEKKKWNVRITIHKKFYEFQDYSSSTMIETLQQQEPVFNLMNALISNKLSVWASLVMGNLLIDLTTIKDMMAKYTDQCFREVLLVSDPISQLHALRTISIALKENTDPDLAADIIQKMSLREILMGMTETRHFELQKQVIYMLKEFLRIESFAHKEDIIVMNLKSSYDTSSVSKRAYSMNILNELIMISKTISSAKVLISKGVVVFLKYALVEALQNQDHDLVALLVKSLLNVLVTEVAIQSFLDTLSHTDRMTILETDTSTSSATSADASSVSKIKAIRDKMTSHTDSFHDGWDVLKRLLISKDNTVQTMALSLCQAITKKVERGIDNSDTDIIDQKLNVLESIRLDQSFRPYTRNIEKIRPENDITSVPEFTTSCYLYMQEMSNSDGIPIWYKGQSATHYINNSNKTVLISPDLFVKSNKVYFEVTLRNQSDVIVGWLSENEKGKSSVKYMHPQHRYPLILKQIVDEVNGDMKKCAVCTCDLPVQSWAWQCSKESAFQVCESCLSQQAIPVPSRCYECSPSNITGDILSIHLDDNARTIHYGINGAETVTYTGSLSDIKDWSEGFYPVIILPPGAEIDINYGMKKFSYSPKEGYSNLLVALTGRKDIPVSMLMYNENRATSSSDSWLPLRLSQDGVSTHDYDETSISLSVLNSCRLNLSLGLERKDATTGNKIVEQENFVSKKAILPYTWYHCVTVVTSKYVQFYINGKLDISYPLGRKNPVWNTNRLTLGSSSAYFSYDGTGVLWAENLSFGWSNQSKSYLDQRQTPYHEDINTNFNRVMRNEETINTFYKKCLVESQIKLAKEEDEELSIISFLLTQACHRDNFTDFTPLHSFMEKDTIRALMELLFKRLSTTDAASISVKLSLAQLFCMMSRTRIGRKVMIEQGAFMRLLQCWDTDTKFWLEIALCNLHSTSSSHKDSSNSISFTKVVEPFGTTYVTSQQAKWMPIASYPFMEDTKAFVLVFNKALAELNASLTKPADASGTLSWDTLCIIKLLIDIFSVTIIRPTDTITTVDPTSHPYENNENKEGIFDFIGALKLSCTFDEQTSTELNCDYIQFYNSGNKDDKSMIRTNSASDGKFSGYTLDRWNAFDLIGHKLYYTWTTDASNTDWGVRMHIKALYAEIPDRDDYCDRLVSHGLIKPLLLYRRVADKVTASVVSKILIELFKNVKARDEVTSGGFMDYLVSKLNWYCYKAVKEVVIPSGGGSSKVIPAEDIFYVDSREWIAADGTDDPSHTSRNGFYRLHVIEPVTYKGYLDLTDDLKPSLKLIDPHPDFLKTVGTLCLTSNNRKLVSERGGLQALLRIARTEDPLCLQAVCMALNDLAYQDIEKLTTKWFKSGAAYQVISSLQRDGQVKWSTNHSLEYVPVDSLIGAFPEYSGEGFQLIGKTVSRANDLDMNKDLDQMLGTVKSINAQDRRKIKVEWNNEEVDHYSYYTSQYYKPITVVRDEQKNIIGYPYISRTDCLVYIDCRASIGNTDSVDIFKFNVYDGDDKLCASVVSTGIELKEDIRKYKYINSSTLKFDFDAPGAMSEEFEITVYVTPVTESSISRLRICQSEDAYYFLRDIIIREDMDDMTRVYAIEAIGKLSILKDPLSSTYVFRDRIIHDALFPDESLFGIILQYLKSTSTIVRTQAWKTLHTIVSDDISNILAWTQLLEQENLYLTYSNMKSFIAYSIYRLTLSSFQPMMLPATNTSDSFEAVELNTIIRSNYEDFPSNSTKAWSTNTYTNRIMFTHATQTIISFNPRSLSENIMTEMHSLSKDTIELYSDETMKTCLLSLTVPELKALILDKGNQLCYDKSNIYIRYNSRNESIDDDDPICQPFSLVAYAKYADFEQVIDWSDDQNTLKSMTSEVNSVTFPYAEKLYVTFVTDTCYLGSEDKLIFYRDKDCLNIERTIIGSNGTLNDFIFPEFKLYYKIEINEADTSVKRRIRFRVQPQFLPGPTDENLIAKNITAFCTKVKYGGTNAYDGIQLLNDILSGDKEDLVTRQFTAMSFLNVSTYAGSPLDPYRLSKIPMISKSGHSGRDDDNISVIGDKHTEMKKSVLGGPIIPKSFLDLEKKWNTTGYNASSRLFANRGVQTALRLMGDNDPTIRRLGCMSLVRFIPCRNSKSTMIDAFAWKYLSKLITLTYNSNSTLDQETCRASCWLLYQFACTIEYRSILGSCIGILIECMGSNDYLTSKYASAAIFQLSLHPSNRQIVLQSPQHVKHMIRIAQVSTDASVVVVVEEKYQQELRNGVARVIFDICCHVTGKDDLKIFLSQNLASILYVSLKNLSSQFEKLGIVRVRSNSIRSSRDMKIQPESANVSSKSKAKSGKISADSYDLLYLIIRCFKRISSNLDVLKEYLEDSTWQKIIEELGKLFTLQVYISNKAFERLNDIMINFSEGKLPALNLLTSILCKLFEVDSLRDPVAIALLSIAKTWWKKPYENSIYGKYVFEKLIAMVTDPKSPYDWSLSLQSDVVTCKQIASKCMELLGLSVSLKLNPTITDALSDLYNPDCSVVLQFLSVICKTKLGQPIEENQSIVYHTLHDNISSKCRFRNNDGILELYISTNQTSRRLMWRTLQTFYMYEVVTSSIDYVNEMLKLWIAVSEGRNNVNIKYQLRKLISYPQLQSCLTWAFEKSDRLRSAAGLILELMNSLYVDYNEEIVESIKNPTRFLSPKYRSSSASPSGGLSAPPTVASNAGFMSPTKKVTSDSTHMLVQITSHFYLIDESTNSATYSYSTELRRYIFRFFDQVNDLNDLDPALLLSFFKLLHNEIQYGILLDVDNTMTTIIDQKEKNTICLTNLNKVREKLVLWLKSVCTLEQETVMSLQIKFYLIQVLDALIDSHIYLNIENMVQLTSAVSDRKFHTDTLLTIFSPSSPTDESANDVTRAGSGSSLGSFGDDYLVQLSCLSGTENALVVAKHAGSLLVRVRSLEIEYQSRLSTICIYTPAESEYLSFLYESKQTLQGIEVPTLSSADRQTYVDIIRKLQYAISARTYIQADDSLISYPVCKGPDWKASEDMSDKKTGKIVGISKAGYVDVKWAGHSSSTSTYRFGESGKYAVMLSTAGPKRTYHQTLAKSGGIHKVIMELLKQDDSWTKHEIDVTGFYIHVFDALIAFCEENVENRKLFRGPKYLNIIAHYIGKQYHAEKLLDVIIDSNTAFLDVSINLIAQKVTQYIRNKDSNTVVSMNTSKDIVNELNILIDCIPPVKLTQQLTHDNWLQLKLVQNFFLLSLLEYIPDITSLYMELTKLKSFIGFKKDIQIIKWIDLISRCITRNKEAKAICTNDIKIVDTEVIQLYAAVASQLVGLKNRIQVLTSLTVFLNALYEEEELIDYIRKNNQYSLIDHIVKEGRMCQYILNAHQLCTIAATDDSINKGITIESRLFTDDCSDIWTEVYLPLTSKQHIKLSFSADTHTEEVFDYIEILKAPPSWNTTENPSRKYILKEDQTVKKGTILKGSIVEVHHVIRCRDDSDDIHDLNTNHYMKGIIKNVWTNVTSADKPLATAHYVTKFNDDTFIIKPSLVIICDDDGREWDEKWSLSRYSGTTNWPGKGTNAPLLISDSRFIVHFVCDDTDNYGSWKLHADIFDGLIPRSQVSAYDIGMKSPHKVILESKHPYELNSNIYHTIDMSESPYEGMYLAFHPNTATEKHYDCVEIYSDSSHTTTYGEKYSGCLGDRRFPGLDGLEPLYIPSKSAVLHFQSDSSNGDWGYRVIAYGSNQVHDDDESNLNGSQALRTPLTILDSHKGKSSKVQDISCVTQTDMYSQTYGIKAKKSSTESVVDFIHQPLHPEYRNVHELITNTNSKNIVKESWKKVDLSTSQETALYFDVASIKMSRNSYIELVASDRTTVLYSPMSRKELPIHPNNPLVIQANVFYIHLVLESELLGEWGYKAIYRGTHVKTPISSIYHTLSRNMVFTPKDRIQVDGVNYYLTTITPTASAVEPIKPMESPRMISQSEITRLDDIYPVVEEVDENDDVNLLSKESRSIRQPSQDSSLSRMSDPATSPLHEVGAAANRYSYNSQVEGSSSDARVSTTLSRPSGVNPSPVKNKSTTKTEIEYIWIPEFFLKRSAVYNHVESLNVSDLLARKLTTQTKNVNGSLVLYYDDLYFPSLYMDDTLDIVMTDGNSSKNLVRVTENNIYEIPSKRRSLILPIKDTKGKSIHIRYTKTTMSDERTVLQVAYHPEDEFDVLTQSSSQLQGSSTNYQIIDYLSPQRDMKKTHTVNFDKLLTEDDDHTTHQNENGCFYYSQNISFPEKTKEIFIFFPSDTIISDAKQNDCHFTFKSPTDQLECYGHPKLTQAKLPTLASTIPLVIPSNTFAATYHDYGDQKFGYRYIAMDSTHYPVSTPVLNDSMRKDSLFTYFNNQTDTATTIYIDLPLFDDSAYFEVYLDKDSSMKSYVQLGLIFKGATVEPLSSDTSSRCLGLGSTLGTYGLDAMSEVNSETQRWSNGQKSGTIVRNISFSKGAVIGFYINKVDNCVDIYQDGELRIPSAFSLPRVFYSGLCPAFSFSPGQIVAINLGTQEFRTKGFTSADSWMKKYHAHSAQDGQFYVWDSIYKTGWNLLLENQYSKYIDISANIEDVSAYGTAINDLLTVTKQSVIPMTIPSPTTALTTSTAPPQGPPQLDEERPSQ